MRVPQISAVLSVVALFLTVAPAVEAGDDARAGDGSDGAGRARVEETSGQRSKRVNIDLVNADIRNVLRLFGEISGMNFVYGEEIRGTITIRLQGVHWKSALEAILKVKGLDMVREGNIVRVATQEKLAAEREAAIQARRACLQTAKPRTRFIRFSYARAEEMARLVQASLSERGKVTVDSRTNTLIVTDVRCP